MKKIAIRTESKQSLKCVNDGMLAGSGYKPAVKTGENYSLENSCLCGCGQVHYDVGLVSKLNYVSCYKCGRNLPESDKIHWANSTRFEFN